MDESQRSGADALKLENQVCFALYALSRKVTALYRPLLEPLGLTYPQYLVFLVMWEIQSGIAPEFFVGVPVKTLCQRLMLDTGTLTPLLKRMEQEGWLVRQRSRDDEREVLIALTRRGLELRQDAMQIPGAVACQSGVPVQRMVSMQRELREWLLALA